jgi:3-methyladenine DNA glycosylase/8-oxoguanine DNA glycosylase
VRLERELRPRGPYSLHLCTRHGSDATRAIRDDHLTTTLWVEGRAELARVWQRPNGTLVARVESDSSLERLRFVLAVDGDHSEFLRRFSRDPLLGVATRRLRGMRQLRLPTVAQALMRAFCGQLVETRQARALEHRVVRAACRPVGRSGLYAPPTAASLARLAPARLRALGLHARRSAALVRICRELDLERLHELPSAVVAARLERERGIGPWTSATVCLEGLGRYDRGLVGDLTLIRLASALWGRRVEAWETEELLAPYGEWAGLASVYLMMAYKYGLVRLPDQARVRLPPAKFRVASA